MKIFIAGGAGYIGSCCTEYLLNHGHEVTVFDSLVKGYRDAVDPRATFVHGDLCDRELVAQAVTREKPDGIMHFAAFIEVGESMKDPSKYFRNNVAYGINLLDAAVENHVKKIVFSSTAATYGMPEIIPIPEHAETKPINVYGESKLMFERLLHWYQVVRGLDYVALRYFNAAGATTRFGENHKPESHLIPIVLQVAMGQRDSVVIYGDDYDTPDGTCIRDYIHIKDLAEAHRLAMESEQSGVFNLGSGTGYSVKEIIDVARDVTRQTIKVEHGPPRPGDAPRLISDSTLARQTLKWGPQHDTIRDIVESAWRWRQKYPNGYAQ
ncbi:MAG: UDP-glucose 4-epimerase GalE [Candidatus Pacebacteria bacterium]|nr:UDP-glucose 4-epimerase GalE [Candidatus Paceibacterota bacterium]